MVHGTVPRNYAMQPAEHCFVCLIFSSYALKREVKYSLHGIKAPEGHISPRMRVSEHHSAEGTHGFLGIHSVCGTERHMQSVKYYS